MNEEITWLHSDELSQLSEERIEELLYVSQSATSHWQECSISVLESLHVLLLKLMLWAILKRLLVQLYTRGILNEGVLHLMIVVSGLYLLGTQNNHLPPICTFIALTVAPIHFKFIFGRLFGFFMLLYSLSLLLVWQYVFTAEEFLSMRGIMMLMLMKVTSLSFDLANEQNGKINLLRLLSYLLDGSTAIFGPWITYKHYQVSLCSKKLKAEIKDAFRAMAYIAFSLLFVLYSSCVTHYFTELPVIGAYFIAQSFRFSHYFVSWLSAGICLLSGAVEANVVAEWTNIEWPRSLVDVVVSWNVPMHRFLHHYVFRQLQKYGSATSIFMTYAVSSLLHGINFQLSAVLLSLGLYTYAENRLRSKLSHRIQSCIRARKCHRECQHLWKENSARTLAVNMAFRIQAVVHLIYLGMVFDDSAGETGYSWEHTLAVWSNSFYYGHVIGIITLLLSFTV